MGMGFSVNLSVARCLAVPFEKDEDFGKSAPFFIFPYNEENITFIPLRNFF